MSFVWAAAIPLIACIVAISIAEIVGVSGVAGMLLGAGAMVATFAVYDFSPLPVATGFCSGDDRTAGHWGFGAEHAEDER